MKKENITWTKGAVFICTKCGTQINKPAEEMRDYLREQLKSAQVGKEVRVMISGCLSICPDKQQAIAIVKTSPQSGEEITSGFSIDPSTDKEGLLAEIKKTLKI